MKHDYEAALHWFNENFAEIDMETCALEDYEGINAVRFSLQEQIAAKPDITEKLALALMHLYEIVCRHAEVPDEEYSAVTKAAAAISAYEALKREWKP